MDTYGRVLFSAAAAFNLAVAAGLLFLRPLLSGVLGLDPVAGTNLAVLYLAAALIATFGYAYACAARDARKYRVYISLGVLGKLLAVAALFWLAVFNGLSWRLPGFASGDLVFALLFADYLRRTRDA